jgi:D-glycero-beta-D-manno-heptose-7-phosphate kinase
MTDPFRKPTSDNKDADKPERKQDSGSEPAPLTIDGKDDRSIPANSTNKRDTNVEQNLGKLDISIDLSFGGGRGVVPLGKSEFAKTEGEKRVEQVRPMIQNFLRATPLDEKLAQHDYLKQIADARESLSNATNPQDAVSDALHLARLYQHMRYIEEAKKAIDLSLGIDPSNQHVDQLFRELERMHSAELGGATTSSALGAQPLSKSNLRKRILNLTGGKVIVIGDLLIDELLEGKPERISREAPVLILEHVDTELIPGGAANTANNIASLGGKCHAIGVVGHDDYASKMAMLFDRAGITHGLVKDPTRPTTVKTRILSKSFSFRQQLLRLDRISHDRVSPEIEKQLLGKLSEVQGEYNAIVLSDYRAGVMTDDLIRAVRGVAAEKNLLLIVDAQDDFARFQNVTMMTPNQPDAEKAVGFEIKDKESLQRAGDELLMITGAKAMLITRGGEGMVLFQQGQAMIELPAFNRLEVFDVSGAGDTVVATMALALTTGCTFLEAMALGNLAAGIVVKKPGTAVTTQKEMLENLDMLKLQES